RRIAAGRRDLVAGLHGIDIDPAAVSAARAAIRELAGAEPEIEVGNALGATGRDRWVGGIEPDVATVITQHAVRSLLSPGGTLAFVITGTVFANESSERFRRFDGAKVLLVEDYAAVNPFAEATHPTLLVLREGEPTTYPVPYRVHRRDGVEALLAAPVPGTDAGPWLKGTAEQHATWRRIFGPGTYRARKGVTTDLNGAFFVHAEMSGRRATIRN